MMLSTHRCHCFCKVQDHNLKGEGLGIKGGKGIMLVSPREKARTSIKRLKLMQKKKGSGSWVLAGVPNKIIHLVPSYLTRACFPV
jgi:hypothetical protein